MNSNKSFHLKSAILSVCFFIFILKISAFAQSAPDKNLPVKNFGSSLKKFEKKENEPPKKGNKKDQIAPLEDTIRVDTDLVIVNISVVDAKGISVQGLRKEDFIVTEDNTPQKVELFSFGENAKLPRSIVLIIDCSGSLSPYLKTSIEAAKNLVDKLGSQDQMAIVTDEVKLLAGFTKDKVLLKEKLNSLERKSKSPGAEKGWFDGHSLQYSALIAALQELFIDDLTPIIIFQTDGDELAILKPSLLPRNLANFERRFGLNDIRKLVENSRATIYSIIPGTRFIGLNSKEQLARARMKWGNFPKLEKSVETSVKMQSALFDLAKLSGGYTDFIEKPEDVNTVYSTIFSVINNRYTIGYYPLNQIRDGRQRNVKIEVREHPEYTIMGRKTYIASASRNL